MNPQYHYSHQSKICNEVANYADSVMVDRAFKALQNVIKILTKNFGLGYFFHRILLEIGFGRYLGYFDFKN
jgi:hypothetical protein